MLSKNCNQDKEGTMNIWAENPEWFDEWIPEYDMEVQND